MHSDKAILNAAQHLTSGADLEELRSAAEDLRALSPESALAQLVEERIGRIEDEASQLRWASTP